MTTESTYVSTWKHINTGNECRILTTREINCLHSTFRITGYNPLPCFEFKGTYGILAQWLKANGWVRIYNANEKTPDIIYIRRK